MFAFLNGRGPSFKHAWDGFVFVLVTQKNAWIHLFFTIVVIIAGLVLKINLVSWLAITISIGLVWSMEIVNTAIEALVDLVSPQFHPTARIAKDAGAAAVLVTAFISVIVGLIVFLPAIFNLFRK